jgi:acetyl esterase/lipase
MTDRLRFSSTHAMRMLALAIACAATGAHAAIAAAASATSAAADGKAPPPVSAFFRDNDMDDVQLSPSGRWIAMTTEQGDGHRALLVVDLQGKEQPSVAAAFRDTDIERPRWISDERLVFSTVDLHRGGGDQVYGPGLYAVERRGGNLNILINPTPASGWTGVWDGDHWLMRILPGGTDDIIVGQSVADRQGNLIGVNATRYNVATGKKTGLSRGRPDFAKEWLFNPRGEPRVIVAQNEGRSKVYWRAPATDAWQVIAEFPTLEEAFHPYFVDGTDQLFVTAPDGERGTAVLKRFDFRTGRPEPQPFVSTPGFDFEGAVIENDAETATVGVRVETDAEGVVWLDDEMKAIQAVVDAKLPGRINRITCRKCATTGSVLVFSRSDQEPGTWWVYWPIDRKWQLVGQHRRDIVPAAMATLDFHRTHARDGEDLPIWFTTPRMAKGAPPPPAVVLVHGGPWLRGTTWEWNREAQFLASRGYAVIEPEYRSSTGYGNAHFRAGWKQWGGAMQDDVADAVQWAIGQKMIDPKRVCIAGASYGGYAALMGPIRYPGTYRCTIAWVGVTDLRLRYKDSWTSDLDDEGRKFDLPAMVGDPVKDAAALTDESPVEHAAAIRVPVLLAYGGSDRRVPIEHGTRMRDALRAAGNDPEWIVYPDEGHGWLQVETNLDFWSRVEAFLAKNDR